MRGDETRIKFQVSLLALTKVRLTRFRTIIATCHLQQNIIGSSLKAFRALFIATTAKSFSGALLDKVSIAAVISSLFFSHVHYFSCSAECGYNCHEECGKLVVQCRPPRRVSPDSLSVTDSEAESMYSSPRTSVDGGGRHALMTHSEDVRHSKRTPPRVDPSPDEVVLSPTLSDAGSVISSSKNNEHQRQNTTPKSFSQPVITNPVKAYRKSIKQHAQDTIVSTSNHANRRDALNPHTFAKTFARLVARSRAFFTTTQRIYEIYSWQHPPTSIGCVVAWIAVCEFPPIKGLCVCVWRY